MHVGCHQGQVGCPQAGHRVAEGEDDNFYVRDMREIMTTLTGTTQVLTTLLGAVAAVSLLLRFFFTEFRSMLGAGNIDAVHVVY